MPLPGSITEDENERLNHANREIAAAAEVMEELARGLVKS